MKIGLVSDLHFEMHADDGQSCVAELDTSCDVLVAAGDIAVAEGIGDALSKLCSAFKQVVYVCGNHEYYTTTRDHVHSVLFDVCATHGNLHWLRPGYPVTLNGQRFVGGTLWFPKHPTAPRSRLNDFKLIAGFERWVYDENRFTARYLKGEMTARDIVVTHHLPSQRSVSEQHRGSILNPFYVCDLEPVIREVQPKLWLHGHTHDTCDYRIGKTRVACNPHGYPHQLNAAFQRPKLLSV